MPKTALSDIVLFHPPKCEEDRVLSFACKSHSFRNWVFKGTRIFVILSMILGLATSSVHLAEMIEDLNDNALISMTQAIDSGGEKSDQSRDICDSDVNCTSVATLPTVTEIGDGVLTLAAIAMKHSTIGRVQSPDIPPPVRS
jgi:hypothetical protein